LEVAGSLLIGRGADLHVIHRGNWYRANLDQLGIATK
jgi:hypothetical protein